MTRILYVLITFLFAILASTSCTSPGPTKDTGSALLWEITKPGHKNSFLLGTMHTDEKDVLDSHRYVDEALEQVDAYVMEVVITDAIQQQAQRSMFIPHGQALLNEQLDAISWQRFADKAKKRGIPAENAAHLKPWAAFTILNVPEQDSDQVMDTVLQDQSKSRGLEVLGLENIDDQIGTLDKLPLAIQLKLLKDYLYFENADDVFDVMKKHYLNRDLDGLLAQNETYMKFTDPKTADIFIKRLVTDRNYRMRDGIIDITRTKASFIAVGALHLPGKDGLLHLLRQQGFSVKPIY